jgi:hypothetical protein
MRATEQWWMHNQKGWRHHSRTLLRLADGVKLRSKPCPRKLAIEDCDLASAYSLIIPRALPAPAFEHVDDGARAGVDHRSNQLQSFTAGTAGLVRRLAFQNGDLLTEE